MGKIVAAILLCAHAWYTEPLLSRADVRKALDYIRDNPQARIDKQIAIAQIPGPPFHEPARTQAMAGVDAARRNTNGSTATGWRLAATVPAAS